MTTPERSTGFFVAAMGLLFCTIMGTASAVVFAIVYAAAIQVLAFGGVIFWVLVLGAFAGAIGGSVFGAAYWMLFVRCPWPSRLRAALCAGGLGALIFALLGVGFLVWESSVPADEAPSIVIEASPDGGRVIEQRERASDVGRSFRAFFMTAGVTGAGGFLYGFMERFVLFGPDPAAIEPVFTNKRLDFLESEFRIGDPPPDISLWARRRWHARAWNSTWCLEAGGSWLLAYRPVVDEKQFEPLHPDHIDSLLKAATRVYQAFLPSGHESGGMRQAMNLPKNWKHRVTEV